MQLFGQILFASVFFFILKFHFLVSLNTRQNTQGGTNSCNSQGIGDRDGQYGIFQKRYGI